MGATQAKAAEALGDEELLRLALAFIRERPSLKEAIAKRISSPIDFEDAVSGPPDKAPGVAVVFQTSWARPHIHCRVGPAAPWTGPPGLPLGKSQVDGFDSPGWFAMSFPSTSTLEFVLNDGGGQWMKGPGDKDFSVARAGLWIVREGQLSPWQAGAALPAPAAPAPAPLAMSVAQCGTASPAELAEAGGVSILYHTGFQSPCVHCRVGPDSPWTQPPGLRLAASQVPGYDGRGWFCLRLPEAQKLEFLFNDGSSSWDKAPGGGNFTIPRAGAWRVAAGKVEDATAAPQPTVALAPAPAQAALGPALTSADMLAPPQSGLPAQTKLDGITLLYYTSWESPYLHCRVGPTSAWTVMPGLPLHKASGDLARDLVLGVAGSKDEIGGAVWFAAHLPKLKALEFVVNDGGPHFRWDKAGGGRDFQVGEAGAYVVHHGRLEKLPAPPEVPSGVEVKQVARASVSLAWAAASGGVKAYRIFRDGEVVASTLAGTTSYTDSGLLASSVFRYEVAAVGPQGMPSERSKPVEAKTKPAGKPGAPLELRCTVATTKKIELEFVQPEDTGGAPVTAFVVSRNGQALATVLAGAASDKVAWSDTSVSAGASYTYSVTACHLPAENQMRDEVLKARKAAGQDSGVLLSIPKELNEGEPAKLERVEAVEELELAPCSKELQQQLGVKGFTVFYRSHWSKTFMHCKSLRPGSAWTELPGLPMTESPAAAFPAAEGWVVLYFPYAAAGLDFVFNDGGNQWEKAPGGANFCAAMSGAVRVMNGQAERVVSPPQAPTKLTAKVLDGSRIELSWTPPPVGKDEGPVVGYRVYRGAKLLQSIDASACTFVDVNLFASTDYEYTVSAVNHQQASGAQSQPVAARTGKPGPPSAPRALRGSIFKVDGAMRVKLEWEPPTDCGGAPIAQYEILRNGTLWGSFQVHTDQLEEETNKAQPVEAVKPPQQRWLRSTASYSTLSWFKDALEWVDEDVEAGETYAYQVVAVQLGKGRANELKTMRRCSSRLLDEVQDGVKGPASEQAQVKAVAFVDIPRLGEAKTKILFQAFDWNSHHTPNWYLTVQGMLPELRSAGVNMIWLPPPSDSVDHHGYLPRMWYKLDSHYGSASMLQDLVMAMNEQDMAPVLDLVVNHRCAAAQDSQGRWLVFKEPDWGGWAICRNSPAVPGGSGSDGTGVEMAQFAPAVDHTNPQVKADVKEFIRHMMEDIGFRAIRFDMVKGYGPRFQAEYVRAAGNPFSVAENWNGDVNGLADYVRECQGVMAAFDFPFYYNLKRSIQSNNFSELRAMDGRLSGLVGRDPVHTCTFIENHDTAQLAAAGGCFGNNEQVLRGYAIILTHPGVPTVFMGDYNRGSHVREKILALCSIRQEGGIHVTSNCEIREARGGLYAAICGGKVAVKVGTDDWNPGNGWTFALAGHEFCVWVRR